MSERWKELVHHPLWKELWEGDQSIVAQERKALEERVRDVRVTDAVESMRFKAMLHGMDYVRVKAEQMAQTEPARPEPLPAPPKSPWLHMRKVGG